MTLKLLILGAAVLATVSGCVVRPYSPYGESPGYYTRGNSHHEDRDHGDRDYRGGHDDHEHRNDR